MEKDKVESRTDNENTSYYKEVLERQGYIVSRPSVPQQGQALSFKEWGKDKFEIDDTHVLFKDVQDYLAASRSEEATALTRWEIGFRNIVTILVGARTEFDIPEIVERVRSLKEQQESAGAPAAGLMPSCTVCGEIMQGVCKCGNKTGVSGAAGSAERERFIQEAVDYLKGMAKQRQVRR